MNLSWSDDQRLQLEALGYVLYRSATPTTHFDSVDSSVSTSAKNRGDDAAIEQATDVGPARRVPHAIDPLVRALLRAARVDPGRVDDSAGWLRAQQIPSLTQLRNNPASKRALWPRLRALRRDTSAR